MTLLKKDTNQMFEELYHLQNCEMAMGIYYQQLAEHYPGDKMFWEEAIGDMVNQARRVGELISKFASNPDVYKPGKYRVAVLETFLSGVYEHVHLIEKKSLAPNEMLRIAFDYESSVIMSKPYDIIDSIDRNFGQFKTRFAEEVSEHNLRVRQYIGQKLGIQAKAPPARINPMSS
jgi:hypothetical protein